MCSLYTKTLVATGVLAEDGRTAYQSLEPQACPMVDRQRAVNEIALIDNTTGEVSYGIKSIFKVFGARIPLLKPLFSFSPFIWVMTKVYAFISYNRRVIAPPPQASTYALQPTFRLNYRLAYLLFTWWVTASILTAYVPAMHGLLQQGSAYREYLICGGQLFFQGAIITIIAKDKLWAYLGNLMTISFAGGLLLLPALVISHLAALPALFYAGYFAAVAGLMFLEHIRRTKLLGLGWLLSASWVSYRLLLLLLIYLAN